MAFHRYPDAEGNRQERPLGLEPGGASGITTIGPLPATDTSHIRIAWSPAGAVHPAIALKADAGDETAIPMDGMAHPVFNRPAGGGVDAGDAILDPPIDGVYRLRVFLQAAATWAINIRNNDAAAHTLTWVVADSDADSRQPWIHVNGPAADPTAVAFETTFGRRVEAIVSIVNLGTAAATVTGLDPELALPYSVAGMPIVVTPNAAAPSMATIVFEAPNVAADLAAAVHTLVIADKPDPGPFGDRHNVGLTLSARVTAPVPEPPVQLGPCHGRTATGMRCLCTGFVSGPGHILAVCRRRGCGHNFREHVVDDI